MDILLGINEGNIMANRKEKKILGQTKVYDKAIKNWPEDERPREKLFKAGEHTLSNTELLAILLRSGVKGQSAVDLSRKIVSKFKTFRNMSHTDLREWKEFKGLGQAKIAQIKAALEIGRRFREVETKEDRAVAGETRRLEEVY
jgi:DNA repair protein RadC